MNIKQAEELSGVSKQNIRFYEREGLIYPARNRENDYREYTSEDIRTLKFIRAMRMLDMPLEQIKMLLTGKIELGDAARIHHAKLEERSKQLETAMCFCQELMNVGDMDTLNIDKMLKRMESPESMEGMSNKWKDDYRKVVLAEREKVFTFIPDAAVTNSQEFTMALFSYAESQNLDLIVTKESMYPEFTINGIEYTAERYYNTVCRVPVATIRCQVKHPEDFEPDVPEGRKKLMKLLNLSWLLLLLILMNIDTIIQVGWRNLLSSWEGWIVLLSVIVLAGTSLYRTWLFHFNEKN